jgi:hypothetical protein
MTTEKLRSVFMYYAALLQFSNEYPALDAKRIDLTRRGTDVPTILVDQHLLWMCRAACRFIDEGRVEKAMRWLGFLQGMFYARGTFSIQELGEHSRPDELPSGD